MRSTHRRRDIAERISSGLEESDRNPLGTDPAPEDPAGGTPDRRPRILAAVLILAALAAPLVFLLYLLSR